MNLYKTPPSAIGLLLVALVSASFPPIAPADPAPKPLPRKLLYPKNAQDVPPSLKPHVERLLSGTAEKQVDPSDATARGVFFRVISRKDALSDEKLKETGWLGSRPFVFLTVPETAYGRDLLGTFSAVGYDPEEIVENERDVEKVAVVFEYPERFRLSDARDGCLPADWDRCVHSTSWDNVFALVDHMTAAKDRWVAMSPNGDSFVPIKLQFRSERELAFALGFPDEGKKRVRTASYAALREVGGADWSYRQLIERLFGASEHFRGDGRTKLTLAGRRKPRAGFPEYLGPNVGLKDLPAVAVVGLGTLRISE